MLIDIDVWYHLYVCVVVVSVVSFIMMTQYHHLLSLSAYAIYCMYVMFAAVVCSGPFSLQLLKWLYYIMLGRKAAILWGSFIVTLQHQYILFPPIYFIYDDIFQSCHTSQLSYPILFIIQHRQPTNNYQPITYHIQS